MSSVLFIALAVLVVVHLQFARRRHGLLAGTTIIRDIVLAGVTLYAAIEGSAFALNYAWWKELGQLPTFWQYLRIKWAPELSATLIAVIVLALVFAAARRHAESELSSTRAFGWLGYAVAGVAGLALSTALIDPWTVAMFLGSRATDTSVAAAPAGYRDPLFGKPLAFYLFRLPFYEMIFGWLAGLAIVALILYGATLAFSYSGQRLRGLAGNVRYVQGPAGYGHFEMQREPRLVNPPPAPLSFATAIRVGAIVVLALFAVNEFFARYSLLYSRHDFLYGADYVDSAVGLPFYWVQIAGCVVLALAIAIVRPRRRAAHAPDFFVAGIVASFFALLLLPPIVEGVVRTVKVHPNELFYERPYITDHIRGTRLAYGLNEAREQPFTPSAADSLDLTRYPQTMNNIRLWDWGPFRNNITQLQALRQYYTFPDVDVDRYPIGGSVRELMIAARHLDPSLLPQQAQSWQNLRLYYTHGYGAVAAPVNRATPEGQPDLILRDAPPVTDVPALHITRPELYFGEQTDTSVFVDTTQPEFDYPKGDDNAETRYQGAAGIPVGSAFMRFAASVAQDDWNILFSGYFRPETRLLLHRNILERVQTLAPFLRFDPDPYLVIDGQGRLFWMLDAYTTSDLHPYSQPVEYSDEVGEINYIRNSVKVTVDAYNGAVRFYVFDDRDPMLAAYRRVFPHLFVPRSQMPPDLLRHIRYPEMLFSIQSAVYSTYHMQDPQVFYNKEDQWDVARQVVTQEETRATPPYYVMVQLPGDQNAEFVLMLPFTSRHRDNLIAWVAARCDPAHYGEIVFFRLPKDQLVYGPLQIQSRVDQDRTISKDLTLWNQQGSRVIRGSTLVLPVDGTFLYVEPISIQAAQASMPELKKIVLALGNRLVYSDDLPGAIAELAQPSDMPGAQGPAEVVAGAGPPPSGAQASAVAATAAVAPRLPANSSDAAVLHSIQQHLQRYRELTSAGRLSEAGKELEAIESETRQALNRQ
jgi:uncharacterized membrane protein (UPF0182 family)